MPKHIISEPPTPRCFFDLPMPPAASRRVVRAEARGAAAVAGAIFERETGAGAGAGCATARPLDRAGAGAGQEPFFRWD